MIPNTYMLTIKLDRFQSKNCPKIVGHIKQKTEKIKLQYPIKFPSLEGRGVLFLIKTEYKDINKKEVNAKQIKKMYLQE